jgi:hypothetical protein
MNKRLTELKKPELIFPSSFNPISLPPQYSIRLAVLISSMLKITCLSRSVRPAVRLDRYCSSICRAEFGPNTAEETPFKRLVDGRINSSDNFLYKAGL